MAIDPNFKAFRLEQTWRPAYLINTKGVFDDGYFADEAPSGADFGGGILGCTVHGFSIGDPDRVLTWYQQGQGAGSVSLSLRAAMDLALAEHPDTEYFAIWVTMVIATHPGIGGCGDPVDGLGFVYHSLDDVINDPAKGWTFENEVGDSAWTIGGSSVQIATPVPGGSVENPGPDFDRWYIGSSYPGGLGAGDLGEFAPDLDAHLPHGYLLRPTALTWTGQDASNTANRILWTTAEVDALAHAWGADCGLLQLFSGAVGYTVRPYKLGHPDTSARHAGSISAAPGVAGVRRKGRTIGRDRDVGTTTVSSAWISGGTPGLLSYGDAGRGTVRPPG